MKTFAILASSLAVIGIASAANAGGLNVSVISHGYQPHYAAQPVYYAPPPVYYQPAPVVYQPYYPAYRFSYFNQGWRNDRGWRGHGHGKGHWHH